MVIRSAQAGKSAARFVAGFGMEMVPKQPDSWDLWKDASGVKNGVYGKNTPSGCEWHVLSLIPQLSHANELVPITHAILHATVGQYLALLTGWLSLLSETDAADRPADGQHRQVFAQSRAGQWGLGLRDGGLRM
jgi:hypothetical protein